jgi:hypothetical protein
MRELLIRETVRTVSEGHLKKIVGERTLRLGRSPNGFDAQLEMDVDGVYIDMIVDWRDFKSIADWFNEAADA